MPCQKWQKKLWFELENAWNVTFVLIEWKHHQKCYVKHNAHFSYEFVRPLHSFMLNKKKKKRKAYRVVYVQWVSLLIENRIIGIFGRHNMWRHFSLTLPKFAFYLYRTVSHSSHRSKTMRARCECARFGISLCYHLLAVVPDAHTFTVLHVSNQFACVNKHRWIWFFFFFSNVSIASLLTEVFLQSFFCFFCFKLFICLALSLCANNRLKCEETEIWLPSEWVKWNKFAKKKNGEILCVM